MGQAAALLLRFALAARVARQRPTCSGRSRDPQGPLQKRSTIALPTPRPQIIDLC